MRHRDLALIACILAGIVLSSTVNARLSPPGEAWIQTFDPPYSDTTLKLQLRVYDWWIGSQEKAVVPKGTKFPILDDNCNWDAQKCPSWTLPSDIELQFGPETPQDSHRLSIFLVDTGVRVPIYSAPYERSTPGCSNQDGSVCCGGNEFTLNRDQEVYKVMKMWVSRFNGTLTNAGNQPSNFRSAGAKLTVRSGYYTGTVTWNNLFYQKVGETQPGNMGLKASISFLTDTTKDTINDLALILTQNYSLLLPVSDPNSSGFVVPNDKMNETPAPMDLASWKACRTSRCSSAPAGFCQGGQTPTPYASWRTTTTAKIVADSWNAAGLPNYKTCNVLGNGRKQFMNSDLTMGETHDAQFINCTYGGTYLVPVVMLPRAAVEAGSTNPPPPSPLSSPPPPVINQQSPSPPPPSKQLQSPSNPSTLPVNTQSTAPPSPPPITDNQANGFAMYLVATFPKYTPAQFNATGNDALLNALTTSAMGESAAPYIRYRSITPSPTGGTTVDCVIYFLRADKLPAGALLTNIQEKTDTVFPQSDFGTVKILRATQLGCVVPCGPNGAPGPKTYTDSSQVACTCECNPGWTTQPNQNFDTWVYCMVKTSTSSSTGMNSTTGTGTGAGIGNGTGTGESDVHAMFWRPPVPKYPPPAPIHYDESSGGLSTGAIVGIVAAIFLIGLLAYLFWRTGCTCCCAVYGALFAAFWHRCVSRKETKDEDDEDIEANHPTVKKKAAGKEKKKDIKGGKTDKKEEAPVVKPTKKVKKNQTQPTEEEEEEEVQEEEENEQPQEEEVEEAETDDEEEEEAASDDEEESDEEDSDEDIVSPRNTKKETSSSPKSDSSTKKKKKKKPSSSSGGNKNRRHKHKHNPFDN